MGEASMRKWMRRAWRRVAVCAIDRQYLTPSPVRDGWVCPAHGDVLSGLEMCQALSDVPRSALRMRRQHRTERLAERIWRWEEAIRAEMTRIASEMKAEMVRLMLESARG